MALQIVLGVLLFAAGSVVLARPFVRDRLRLMLAVPRAAVIGLAALGVLAVILAAFAALLGALGDTGGGGGGIGDLLSGIDWPERRKSTAVNEGEAVAFCGGRRGVRPGFALQQ